VLLASAMTLGQGSPVPLINEPLVPTVTEPGGPSFMLNVNGVGFVSGSLVNWNGTPLTTTFVSNSQVTAAVPASNIATAATASVTVSNPTPGGGTSNVLFFGVSAPTTLQFTSFPANNGFVSLAGQPIAADFNRDGKLDFAVVNFVPNNSYTISIFLGNGDGTFQLPKFAPTNGGFRAWAIGDFNGDGIPDLASNNCFFVPEAECSFNIVLGNGDGTFSFGNEISLVSGQQADQPVTGDFNGDGKLDVAFAITGGLSVFLGNGAEHFRTLRYLTLGL